MIARLRQWLEETHSDTFELVRHVLARFFDTEFGASSADWHKVAIGVFACLVSLGIIGYMRKKLPMVERVLLIIVALAMVIAPIGWSIPGLAPLAVGVLMILHHLRVTRAPA